MRVAPTLDQAVLIQLPCPLQDDYARRVTIFRENGVQVNGSFVPGFDHDRIDVFERTVEVSHCR